MFSFEKITTFLLLWARAVYMIKCSCSIYDGPRADICWTDLHSTMTHHWTFNEPFPYEDHKTGQRVKLIGDKKPLNTTGYLSLVGESCLILGSITDRCLANMTTCHSGYSVAFWVQIKATATSPQILLGTSRNGTDIHGVFVYQTGAIGKNRTLIAEISVDGLRWSVPFTVHQEMWVFIALSWNIKDDIFSVYTNGNNVSTTAGKYGSEHLLRKHLKLIGSFPRQEVPPSLYLESGGLYDEVMTWNRSLDHSEVKRLFQARMNELSKIKCTTTASTLNITWQAINRTIFTKVRETNQEYKVKVWRNKQRIAFKDLESSIRNHFLRRMVPYASYKVRLWKGGQRIGAVVCHTKEGVPTKVQNLRITAGNSTSLLVRWSPPAQINGLLLGYNLTVKKDDFYRVITVKDTTKYLVTDLKPDTMYTIDVQSYTAAGSGPQPPSHKAATNKVPNVTETPQNLSAIALSWNTVKVTWTPLDEKEEVTSYDVEYCSVIGCRIVPVFDSSVVIDNLTQHTTYTVKVRGRNTKYAGPWRIASGVKTLDLDECKTGRHQCNAHALCENTEGSYKCLCRQGYTGDGSRCDDPTEFCEAELFKNIQWKRTSKGETDKTSCPDGFTGEASRTCSAVGKVTWQKPDLSKCVSKRFLDLKSKISSQTIDSDTAVSLANDLQKITDPADDDLVVSGDLYTAVDILQTLGQKTAKNVTMNKEEAETFMKKVISVANNLLDEKVIDVWQESSAVSRSSRATKLLISIENMALMTASVSNSTNATSIETSNVELAAKTNQSVNRMHHFEGMVLQNLEIISENVLKFRSLKKDTFAPESLFFATSPGHGSGNGIQMPTSEIHKCSEGAINIAFIYMRNIGQLLSNSLSSPISEQNKTDRINSDSSSSVSSGVISLTTSRKTSGNFDEPVVITLQSNKSDHNLQPLCVFWKIEGDAGSWSTEGCLVNFVNSTHTVCHCYHLTSFSVLMQYTPDSHRIKKSDELALGLITYIGISVSLVALVIALMTFCSVGFLKSNRNFAHINLVLSLILAELLFVFGIDKIEYQTACFVIAVFLHYLFLVAFSWMATEGVILYLMLVKVFPTSSEGPKKRLLFICSWGIPTIPVASAILINKEGYTTDKHCWLSVDEGFVWSFIGPVLLVCVVNIVFLGMTFKAMADRTSKQCARKPPQMRYWVKACAVLTCLLGTTWLLGLFFLGKSSVVMAYLFNIFNVLQGLFIFIFHCLADERIRAQYRRVICCHGNRREYLRNKLVVKSEQHKHSHSTMSSRFADKKSKSEEKRPSFCDAETVAVRRDSSGILFAEQEPIQGTDRYPEIPSMPVTADQDEENSELTPPLDVFSDVDETDHHDDEEKSVDMFFEDISLSLIDIRKDRTSSSLECKSIISNPLENM